MSGINRIYGESIEYKPFLEWIWLLRSCEGRFEKEEGEGGRKSRRGRSERSVKEEGRERKVEIKERKIGGRKGSKSKRRGLKRSV